MKKYLIMIMIIVIISIPKIIKAETISFEDKNGIIYYNPAGYDISNTRQNTLYYNSSSANPASFYAPIELLSTADYPAVFNGQYLIDFYIYGVGTFYQNYSCNGFSSNFRYIDLNSGNWISASSKIKSQCIAINKTKYNGYDAIHLLYKFTLNTDNNIGATYFSVQITQYNFFTAGPTGTNIGYAIGNLYDYDVAIVDGFKNGAKLEEISNAIEQQTQQQHQDSLNEQNAINGITNADYNGTLEQANTQDYNDYQTQENNLLNNMQSMDLNSVNIAIDQDSSNFVWNTMTRLIQSHSLIFSMIISILSIGVIKLMLSR